MDKSARCIFATLLALVETTTLYITGDIPSQRRVSQPNAGWGGGGGTHYETLRLEQKHGKRFFLRVKMHSVGLLTRNKKEP